MKVSGAVAMADDPERAFGLTEAALKVRQPDALGVTWELATDADGTKFYKTEPIYIHRRFYTKCFP